VLKWENGVGPRTPIRRSETFGLILVRQQPRDRQQPTLRRAADASLTNRFDSEARNRHVMRPQKNR